jgi:hypothetical protein
MRQIIILSLARRVGGSYLALRQRGGGRGTWIAGGGGQPRQVSAGQHKTELSSGRAGHFQGDTRVDGRHIEFMIDTGASLVILRELLEQ